MATEPAAVRRLDRGAHLSTGAPARLGSYSYGAGDLERWASEDPKRNQSGDAAGSPRVESQRGEFQRDRARVLHSYAFRRLADKTQVVSPGSFGFDDFPRTRLTHSLEVAQIGREMGAALGCDPDVVDAAGLAHDLGHPPFGHNGEDALNSIAVAGGCDGFEGNAQTLRILTRLEAKAVTADPGRPVGLNLTRASLDAVCKYPWPAAPGRRKFGVYAADLAAYRWLRDGRPDGARCLEAQVMDWADDVAYSVHDVEDGVHAGHIDLTRLADDAERQALCRSAAAEYSELPPDELAPALERLLQLEPVRELAAYDGSFTAQGRAKRATSELTGRFVGAAVGATVAQHGPGPVGRYAADLVVPAAMRAECALLKAMAFRYVMRRDGVEAMLVTQRRTVTELVEVLLDRGEAALSPVLGESWRHAATDVDRLRVAIDQVAQLTDSAALAWHAALIGPGRPQLDPATTRARLD